jgi:hypothetical protein
MPVSSRPAAPLVPRSLTWEERRWRRRRRWTIGGLEPYRIKVMLVENSRVAGKVRQEIITVLGSIDASYLESFWQRAPDPALRHQHWEALSLAQRTAFWEGVIERMTAIGDNRLSKDDRVAARRAIHRSKIRQSSLLQSPSQSFFEGYSHVSHGFRRAHHVGIAGGGFLASRCTTAPGSGRPTDLLGVGEPRPGRRFAKERQLRFPRPAG